MTRKNKNNNNTDAFIAQSLIEIERPTNNRATIIFVCFIILLIVGGVGVYLYTHRDKFDWEIRLPWQSPDEPPIFGGNSKDKDKNKEKLDLVIPEIIEAKLPIQDSEVSFANLKHDDKGYTFITKIKNDKNPGFSFKIEKVLLDGYAFSVDATFENIDYGTHEYTVRINQTDLDRYKIESFSKMLVFYTYTSSRDNKTVEGDFNIRITTRINYDNEMKNILEIYSYAPKGTKGNNNILYFNRVDSDKDNHYIYFYFENTEKFIKEITIKRLLINEELYEYDDFKVEVYKKSHDIFYLTIPKKKVREIENFNVSFFITTIMKNPDMNATYISSEYSKTL